MPEHEVITLLKRLVSIPSVNPGHTDDVSVSGEMRLAEYLAEWLEARGFALSWDMVEPGRPNLIASYGPDTPKHTLLLESHLDTVGEDGMTIKPFDPLVREGRIYGRGACDTKGPMAAALCAFRPPVLERLAEAGVRLLFVGAMGEEKGNIGAERLVEQGWSADEAIILEPTELAAVNGHKGIFWFQLTVHGISAHGSNPDRGRSAILGMMQVIDQLQKQIARKREQCANTEMGLPTLNIGFIEGGTAVNVVPNRCTIEVDRRLVIGESGEQTRKEIREVLQRLADRGVIQSYDLETIKEGPPFRTAPESALIGRFDRVCREFNVTPRMESAAWYSDAGAISRICSSVVVFGPGSIKQAHTNDEYIVMDELLKGHDILARYLERFAEEMENMQGDR